MKCHKKYHKFLHVFRESLTPIVVKAERKVNLWLSLTASAFEEIERDSLFLSVYSNACMTCVSLSGGRGIMQAQHCAAVQCVSPWAAEVDRVGVWGSSVGSHATSSPPRC